MAPDPSSFSRVNGPMVWPMCMRGPGGRPAGDRGRERPTVELVYPTPAGPAKVGPGDSTGRALRANNGTSDFLARRECVMQCPVCANPLRPVDRQGIEIDVCPQCRGVWLDRGELD